MGNKLSIIWHYAPFGPIKFPVWLWRYATLRRRLTLINDAVHGEEDPQEGFNTGAYIGHLYCQVFPPHVVYAATKHKVEVVGDRVSGNPLYVGLYVYLHHHPRRQR